MRLWSETSPQSFPLRLHRCGSCDQWEDWVSRAGPFWASQNIGHPGTEALGLADCFSVLRDSLEGKIWGQWVSVSLLVMEFSKYYLWEMLFKLRDTSGSGIIYPTSEATSFAFLVSVTPRRVCALGHGDAADTVILACLRSPEGEHPLRAGEGPLRAPLRPDGHTRSANEPSCTGTLFLVP